MIKRRYRVGGKEFEQAVNSWCCPQANWSPRYQDDALRLKDLEKKVKGIDLARYRQKRGKVAYIARGRPLQERREATVMEARERGAIIGGGRGKAVCRGRIVGTSQHSTSPHIHRKSQETCLRFLARNGKLYDSRYLFNTNSNMQVSTATSSNLPPLPRAPLRIRNSQSFFGHALTRNTHSPFRLIMRALLEMVVMRQQRGQRTRRN
jgi:hypothetical protein